MKTDHTLGGGAAGPAQVGQQQARFGAPGGQEQSRAPLAGTGQTPFCD